jgi:hypothetical protein
VAPQEATLVSIVCYRSSGGSFLDRGDDAGIVPGAKQDRESLPPSSSRGDPGIAFCGPCAREQEAYFAIGELTQSLCSKPLAEALERMRRERASGRGGIAAEMHHGFPGVSEAEGLALTKS